MFTRITTAAFPWKTTRKVPVLPVQIGQLPALGVYLIRETMGPDGDSNHGIPRYIADTLYGIMVMDEANKPDVLEGTMDNLVDLIEDTILSSDNGSFLNLRDSGNNPLIDSVPLITRTYDFPREGETQYIQCRLQMTVRYFLCFPPVITNVLDRVVVTVEPPNQPVPPTGQPADPANFVEKFEIDTL